MFQALYYCIPFREQLLEYYANYRNPGDAEENLLTCLADLFAQVKIQILLLADILLHLLGCCSKKSIRVPTLSLTSQCTHGFNVIIKFKDDNIEDYWFYFKYMLTNRLIFFSYTVQILCRQVNEGNGSQVFSFFW